MTLTDRYQKVTIEEVEENKIHVRNLWNDDSFFLRFDKTDDLNFLNDLFFPEELMAIYSLSDGFIEVFAYPLDPEEDLIKRAFNFNYKGREFKCCWKTPTKSFEKIANAFREEKEESRTYYRN